jgi:hypothetical protein
VKNEDAAWCEIVAACSRLYAEYTAAISGPARRCTRPEAAFRITLLKKAEGTIHLKDVVGGIPMILSCALHSMPPSLSARWLPPNPSRAANRCHHAPLAPRGPVCLLPCL